MTRYQLSVEAENFPQNVFLTRWFRPLRQAYAQVTISGGPKEGTVIGRTEGRSVAKRVQWTTPLYIDTESSTIMHLPLLIAIFDESSDALLAELSTEATTVHQSVGRIVREKTSSNVIISVSMEESIKGSASGTINLHLRGLDIKNVEPGLLGLGRSDPFFEVAKKSLDTTAGIVRWITVYRSEHILNHLNPYWKPFSMNLEALCYCDLSWPLLIRVCDYQSTGNHRIIGCFETNLQLLMDNVSVKGNADRSKAFDVLREREDDNTNLHTTRGLIVVVTADYHYLHGQST